MRDLVVEADIGVHEYEKRKRQPLVIDMTVHISSPRSDRLDATLDYNVLVEHAEALACERIDLIESYADRLAARCLSHQETLRVDIRVSKPQALKKGVAEVEIVRTRI